MANDPFTLRIFVPDGDPEGVRIIDRMNWTGLGIVFPREKWPVTKQRAEFSRAGVYILTGYRSAGDELPTIYIGEGDVLRIRIDSHFQNKDFWDRGIVFTASNNSLNKAHVRWLEAALVSRASQAQRCILDNGTEPQQVGLSEAERADTEGFLREVLQILPLVGLRAFEIPKPVATPLFDPNSADEFGPRKEHIGHGHRPRTARGLRKGLHWRELLVCHPHLGRHAAEDPIHRHLPHTTGIGHHPLCAGGQHRALRRRGKVQTQFLRTGKADWPDPVR